MFIVLIIDINYANDVTLLIIIRNMVRISRQRCYHGFPKCIWLVNYVLVKCCSNVNMMYMSMIIINKYTTDCVRKQEHGA